MPAPTYPLSHRNAGDVLTDTIFNEAIDGINDLNTRVSAFQSGFPQSFTGLVMQSFHDATNSGKVTLQRLDYWITQGGSVITDGAASNVVMDPTASGAGGLDTGSWTNSRWYRIYRIRKSSDGTLNMLASLAKRWAVDQSQGTSSTQFALNQVTAGKAKYGQKFTAGVTGYRPFVDISVDQQGSPAVSSNLIVKLCADSAGSPGTVLATAEYQDFDSLSNNSEQKLRFIFRTPVSLTASTSYWYTIESDYAASDTIYANVRGTNSGSNVKSFASGSWSAVSNATLYFQDYVETAEVAPTMPSGYDQYCLLGYVRSSSSTGIRYFYQFNRTVKMEQVSFNGPSAAVPTLASNDELHPPVPVLIDGIVYSTADYAYIYVKGSGKWGARKYQAGGAVPSVLKNAIANHGPNASNDAFYGDAQFITEFQHCYIQGTGWLYRAGFEF